MMSEVIGIEQEGESQKNDEDFNNQVELYQKYELQQESVEILLKIQKEVPELSLERTIWCILSKKTFKKSLQLAVDYCKVLKEFKIDSIELNQEFYDNNPLLQEIISLEAFFFINERTKDSYGIFCADNGRMKPIKGAERNRLYMILTLKMFDRFLRIHPDNARNGVVFLSDFAKFGWKNVDLRFNQASSQMFKKVPCRMKRAIIFNCPWYIQLVTDLAFSFYSKKIMDRFLVTSRKKLVKKILPPDLIIEQWGGNRRFDLEEFYLEEFGIRIKPVQKYKSLLEKPKKLSEEEEDEGESNHEEEEKGEQSSEDEVVEVRDDEIFFEDDGNFFEEDGSKEEKVKKKPTIATRIKRNSQKIMFPITRMKRNSRKEKNKERRFREEIVNLSEKEGDENHFVVIEEVQDEKEDKNEEGR